MAVTSQEQIRYWGIWAVAVLFTLWFLGDVLLPFVTGMAIAYFLNPIADHLERVGFSRVIATTIITVCALFALLLMLFFLIPLLGRQIEALVAAAPGYVSRTQAAISAQFPELADEDSAIRQGLAFVTDFIQSRTAQLAQALLQSALSLVDFVIFIVVAPVVAFYMLLDWGRMIAKVDSWIPRDHLKIVRQLAREVDIVLAGFVRGQMTVCMILGTFYAIALMITGLQFGLVVGMVAGLLTFIPYVGSVIGGVLSIGLALFQFWDTPQWVGVVAIIFVAGQMLEGNFLTPKLVGGSVGLHPVWLMFALSTFGTLLGFTGLLVAVPVAACLGVFFRFGVGQYLTGRLYTGHAGKEPSTDD
ncbi:MAG: AI-2E family transporter [Rhodobacteraceae bacterium]|nr:AI-2E family transporter [Paracoccaceae bacterium]